MLNIFQITTLQSGEIVYKHEHQLLPRIYDSYFQNGRDVRWYHASSRSDRNVLLPNLANLASNVLLLMFGTPYL